MTIFMAKCEHPQYHSNITYIFVRLVFVAAIDYKNLFLQ